MSDQVAPNTPENFDNMTVAEFETRLPDLFAGTGKVSDDPRFTNFLAKNPDCLALVKDLEYIADAAKHFLEPAPGDEGPAEPAWDKLSRELKNESNSLDEPSGTFE